MLCFIWLQEETCEYVLSQQDGFGVGRHVVRKMPPSNTSIDSLIGQEDVFKRHAMQQNVIVDNTYNAYYASCLPVLEIYSNHASAQAYP